MRPRRSPSAVSRHWVLLAAASAALGLLLALLPLGAHAQTTDEPVPTAAPSTRAATPLRVATFNVCARMCPRLRSWTYRTSRIAREISRAHPDVVALQETGSSARTKILTRRLVPLGYAHAIGGNGNHLYYRTSTVSTRSLADERLPHPIARTPRPRAGRIGTAPIQVFRLLATDAPVIVVNYHLPAYDRRGRDIARDREYLDIERVVGPLARTMPDVPVIKVGDFNSYVQPATRAYDSHRFRTRVWKRLRASRFVDAARSARTTSHARLHTIIRVPGDRRRFGPGRHLDHVFVPRVVGVSRWVLVLRDGPYRTQLSDHRLTYADLVLPGA